MNSYDPTDLSSQDRARKEEETRQRIAAELDAADLTWLMASKKGRRFMWRLLDAAGVTRLSYDRNALEMAFNEGNRNFGNKVLAWILDECPDQYLAMLKEKTNGRSDGSGDNTK